MTLRDDYEHWARNFTARIARGWGIFLDRLYATNADGVTWDDVRVAASVTKLGSSAPSWALVTDINSCYQFAHNQSNFVEFECQLPHGYELGSSLEPHVHWGPSDTGAGDTRWRLDYVWANIGSPFSGTSTTIYVTDTSSEVTNDHQVAGFPAISGTGMGISSMLLCRLTRVGGAVQDTYGSPANFYEFDFHITKDTIGSFEEYVK